MVSARGIVGSGSNRLDADFYPTPTWATEALLARVQFNGLIWEPASGDGAMSKVLERQNKVVSSDLRADGCYGQGGIDFLTAPLLPNVSAVVTNPPYSKARQFVERAKMVADDKVAMLLKLVFLEGSTRYGFFHDTAFSLAKVLVFSRRIQFSPLGDAAGSPTLASAWFVWEKQYKGLPQIEWIK